MSTHHEGLHKLEREVEGALASESAQNGYAQASTTSNSLSPNTAGSPGRIESSATTIAGSRDPTIKHTDSASVRSNPTTAHGDITPSKEKRLSFGEKDGVSTEQAEEDTGLLKGAKLYLVFLSLMLSVFVS